MVNRLIYRYLFEIKKVEIRAISHRLCYIARFLHKERIRKSLMGYFT